jgi:hypothetical protein
MIKQGIGFIPLGCVENITRKEHVVVRDMH